MACHDSVTDKLRDATFDDLVALEQSDLHALFDFRMVTQRGVTMKTCHIRAVLFMIGVAVVFPSWAGLEMVGRNGRTGEVVFVDSDYTRKVGRHIEARFLVTFNEPRYLRSLGKNYRSMITYQVVDCPSSKLGMSGMEIFEDNNWKKKIAAEIGQNPEMDSPRLGTVNEAMLSAACYLSQKR